MTGNTTAPRQAADIHGLAERIRVACVRRGWDIGELARRAGVSRTTLSQLLNGHTDRPHGTTLKQLADALDLDVEELLTRERRGPGSPVPARRDQVSCTINSGDAGARFDRATNTVVTDVLQERPDLFSNWSTNDVDELYSLFGVGGQLNRRGVVAAAESINGKRETIRKLHVVLDTHLRERAVDLIDLLYEMVQVRGRETPAASGTVPDQRPGYTRPS